MRFYEILVKQGKIANILALCILSFFCLIYFHLFFKCFHIKGVLGYPTSFLLDTWQAKRYEVLPLRALDNGQTNKNDYHFQN